MPVSRSGFQAVANAIWSLVSLANRTVTPSGGTITTVTGNVNGTVGSVTGSVSGSVASVTGAVGSVTGNVGGNVNGSVASVTGAVGSVSGNVSGSVLGSVASVAGSVGGNVNGSLLGNVSGSVGSVAAAVTVGTNNDKTGYSVSTVNDKSGYSLTQNSYDVTDFCQRGDVSIAASGNANSVGISTVDLTKSHMSNTGTTGAAGVSDTGGGMVKLTLAATTVSAARASTSPLGVIAGFEIADFAG